jgi:hypothetical protein
LGFAAIAGHGQHDENGGQQRFGSSLGHRLLAFIFALRLGLRLRANAKASDMPPVVILAVIRGIQQREHQSSSRFSFSVLPS